MFTENIIEKVWSKARTVENYDSNQFRKDACGAWIIRTHYGNRDSIYGWEIDHIYPESLGGDDSIENLRVLQWENNLSKGNDYPDYKSVVQSDGNKNIRQDKQFTVNENIQELLKNKYSIEK